MKSSADKNLLGIDFELPIKWFEKLTASIKEDSHNLKKVENLNSSIIAYSSVNVSIFENKKLKKDKNNVFIDEVYSALLKRN